MNYADREKKSLLISLIFTILFGPIGLLYATTIGGIMLLAPFLLFPILFDGIELITGLTIAFLPFAWVISIIWGMVAVSLYNKKIERVRHQNIMEALSKQKETFIINAVDTEDQMLTWLKENPEKTANDYYFERYGGQQQ